MEPMKYLVSHIEYFQEGLKDLQRHQGYWYLDKSDIMDWPELVFHLQIDTQWLIKAFIQTY